MGVESDRLVFDYLSRVGDLAQTAMPAAERMQLVAQLRNDIDRERRGADSEVAVRRILGRMGSPDEVVEAAAGSSGSGRRTAPPPAEEPPAGSYGPYAKRPGPQVPRTAGDSRVPRPGRDGDGAEREWWQGDGHGGRPRPGDELAGLPGMTGGVFIPFDDEELGADDLPPGKGGGAAAEDEAAAEGEAAEPAAAPRRRRLLRRAPRTEGRRNWGSPVLLLAAALLVVGAAIGSLIPLGLGWLTAYLSRRLSRPQAKFAVLFIPGAFAAGLLVWVWGRDVGKWGDPIAQGQMGQAFQDAYPPAIRLAAVGTALYLLWRNRRSA
ncbi:hypothetical protein [Streptomyces sp. NPDC049040]|uniref:hypothetical protein n=1 Tax=Streptomyces sp. NPDC049040 TaxID=3365593 RepID=UPI003723E12F